MLLHYSPISGEPGIASPHAHPDASFPPHCPCSSVSGVGGSAHVPCALCTTLGLGCLAGGLSMCLYVTPRQRARRCVGGAGGPAARPRRLPLYTTLELLNVKRSRSVERGPRGRSWSMVRNNTYYNKALSVMQASGDRSFCGHWLHNKKSS